MEEWYKANSRHYGHGAYGSDLAVERRRANTGISGVEYRQERAIIGSWERIRITSEEGAKSIGRPMGNYDTLATCRMDLMDYDRMEDAKNEVSKELCRLIDGTGIYPERILVVGLGNRALTPDAVGPKAAEAVEATMHLGKVNPELLESLDCSEIAVICPGAAATTGIESHDVVRGVCARLQPDVVIAIDALASRAPERLGTTLQFCDTGIFPGTGFGTGSAPLDERTLGVPVIGIGVPTVIDSRLFVVEEGEAKEAKRSVGMFVSPKEIDTVVEKAAKIIGGGINQAFGIDY